MNLWSGSRDEINYNWLLCGNLCEGREQKSAQKERKQKTQNEKNSCESDFYDEAVKPVYTNAKTFLAFGFKKSIAKKLSLVCVVFLFFRVWSGVEARRSRVSEWKKLINGYKPFYRGKKFMPWRPSNDHNVSDSFFFHSHMHAGR